MSNRRRSDPGQDNNTTSQVLMLRHGEKDIVSNNVQDTLVTLIDNMQGSDF